MPTAGNVRQSAAVTTHAGNGNAQFDTALFPSGQVNAIHQNQRTTSNQADHPNPMSNHVRRLEAELNSARHEILRRRKVINAIVRHVLEIKITADRCLNAREQLARLPLDQAREVALGVVDIADILSIQLEAAYKYAVGELGAGPARAHSTIGQTQS